MSRPDRQTDRQRTAIFRKFWTESGQRTGLRQKNPERQTPDSIFSRNPDRIETDRIRTEDTGQKIQIESGQQTDTGHDFTDKNETKTDKIRTKTRQGQDTDSAVRRRMDLTIVSPTFAPVTKISKSSPK